MIASIRGKKPHVYRVIILKQMADHMKALYLEATLTFLRFAAKHCSIAQLFRGSYQLKNQNYFIVLMAFSEIGALVAA